MRVVQSLYWSLALTLTPDHSNAILQKSTLITAMKEYIAVDLSKRKAVLVEKDRGDGVTGKATLAA